MLKFSFKNYKKYFWLYVAAGNIPEEGVKIIIVIIKHLLKLFSTKHSILCHFHIL